MSTPATTAPALQTLPREDYARLEQRGLAGAVPAIPDSAVAEHWRADYPGWRGRYWAWIGDDGDVLRLRPINVARQSTARAA
ncbi:hypothetical protein [Nocardia xishanensis]|uniref:hypothetical protein n=1 Tax=Nocardia xishanensis TaxID=238964 RepID=UPI00082EE5D7|nr:hypothetical protein [Nocardia xishanensis]